MDFLDLSLVTIIQDNPHISINQLKDMLPTPDNKFSPYLTGDWCTKTLSNRLNELMAHQYITFKREIRDNGFRKYNAFQITPTGRHLCDLLSQKFASLQESSSSFSSEDLSVEISLLDLMELNLHEMIADTLFDDLSTLSPQSLQRCEKAQEHIIRSFCRMLRNHGVKIIESE